jgi:hypothetical protein
MNRILIFLVVSMALASCRQTNIEPLTIDETGLAETVEEVIKIDSVWSGHPVGFCLLTHGDRQYIAYYNANRNMVVGQRKLSEKPFELHVMPATTRETHGGTSTVLGWDSHNYITLALDQEGHIHLSGNVHAHPLTYFRTTVAGDITSLEQVYSMIGAQEDRTTYPRFIKTRDGDLIYSYRDGGSGNGNQIFNIYDVKSKTWTRLLDTPLTDGQGLMNAYISLPQLREDDWYHTYWVWRDTPDCETNHDLSYMKSPDLKTWYNVFGETMTLPATIEQGSAIVDPIPPKGGIINLAAKMLLDQHENPVFVYHKYDSAGNLQLYIAQISEDQWNYHQITDWNYRWEFKGRGSINREVILKNFLNRDDGYYEVGFWHLQYGHGTILLDQNFKPAGQVLKPEPFITTLDLEGEFKELTMQSSNDIGESPDPGTRYMLKWETLNRNRDRPREGPLPEPSTLYLYKLGRN